MEDSRDSGGEGAGGARGPLVPLRSGELEVDLIPPVGGAIARFDWVRGASRRDVLRGGAAIGSVLDTACFPLVPFVNRIRGGRFAFDARTVVLAPNMPPDPSPLHGQGWRMPWIVAERGEDRAVLDLRHEAGEWPWTYEARQVFVLDPDGLTVDLSCRNMTDRPMPCGLGQHPYFPCGGRTILDTDVTHAWTIDEDVLPVERVPAVGPFDLSDRPVCAQGLDHGFAGWNGVMRLHDPGWPFRIEMSSPTARFFQLFSPPQGGFIAAEPVSHANAALNAPPDEWDALGLVILQPGEKASLRMRIAVRVA